MMLNPALVRSLRLLSIAFIILLVLVFSSRAADEYIEYDFSNPAEVFKATKSETVTGSDIDPSALYQILQSGQIVIINDHPNNPDIPWLTTGGILVNAPPERVYAVIEKIDSYPTFMPQVDTAYTKKITDEIDHVFYQLGIQILFLKVKVPYSVYHWNRPPNRVDWIMASGDFKANMGAYEVVAVPGHPEKSMLFYTSYALPRNKVVVELYNQIPQLDMMINLSTGTLVVLAMKAKAEELYKAEGGNIKPPTGKHDVFKLMKDQGETLGRLANRGKVVILEDTDPMYYTAGIIINKPLHEVYECVADPTGQASMSDNVSVEILEQGDGTARIKFHTVIKLMIDFDTVYVVNYKMEPPNRVSWTSEPGGDLQGVAGSWELVELSDDKTLAFFRNTSDLRSQGIMMRQLLKIEPTFEQAIQASQTQLNARDMQRYCEGAPR